MEYLAIGGDAAAGTGRSDARDLDCDLGCARQRLIWAQHGCRTSAGSVGAQRPRLLSLYRAIRELQTRGVTHTENASVDDRNFCIEVLYFSFRVRTAVA